MDTSDPWIQFDSNGICNHCTSFFYRYNNRVTPSLSDESDSIDHIFDQVRARNNRKRSGYDAIVGVSGGTDSSYSIYLAAKAGLKLLAVHLDNGWDTSAALSNVYQITRSSNIDYVSYVLNWNKFRLIQRSFIESGVPDIELPTDIAIYKALFLTAQKYRINTFIVGGNISNEGILPAAWMYNTRDMAFASSIAARHGVKSSVFKEVRFGFRDELFHRFVRNSFFLYPLDKISYDKHLAATILKREVGWTSPGQKHSESVYTRFCQLIYQPRRHGFEYRRAHLSSDICMQRITRQEALLQLKSPAISKLDERRTIAFVANKLGYSFDELSRQLSLPPKWYVDYPNRRRLLGLSYDIYRAIKRQPKLSNF
jgi:hypothetical protein